MAPRQVTPPAGSDAAGSGVDMEAAAAAAIQRDAEQQILADGVDQPEFVPDFMPQPVKMHPRSNYFPAGSEPPQMRQRGPKAYITTYSERQRLETVITDSERQIVAAEQDIVDARRDIAAADAALPEAEDALAKAEGDEAREKAARSVAHIKDTKQRAMQKGAKAVAAKQAAQAALASAQNAISPEREKEARQALRLQRWKNGEDPLTKEEEDVELGLAPAAEVASSV